LGFVGLFEPWPLREMATRLEQEYDTFCAFLKNGRFWLKEKMNIQEKRQ
jgi:hypothetical protein